MSCQFYRLAAIADEVEQLARADRVLQSKLGHRNEENRVLNWRNPEDRPILDLLYGYLYTANVKDFRERRDEIRLSQKPPKRPLSAFCFFNQIQKKLFRSKKSTAYYKDVRVGLSK